MRLMIAMSGAENKTCSCYAALAHASARYPWLQNISGTWSTFWNVARRQLRQTVLEREKAPAIIAHPELSHRFCIVVEDALVPEYRTLSYHDMFHLRYPGTAVNEAPLYGLPFGSLFSCAIAAPAVGTALGALRTFREQTKTRVSARDSMSVAEDPFIQFRLAEATAEVDAVHDRLLRNCEEMIRLTRAGQEIPLAYRARYRWDTAKAVDGSVRAVDRLFEASGGRSIFLQNPLQRAWRDVHAMRAHVSNNPERAAAVFGRSEFGLPPQDLRF